MEERCVIHIENCPAFYILNQELSKLNIDNGMCSDAEKWLKYRWRARLPQVNFISYWEYIRPPKVDELEQVEFIGDWDWDLLLGENDYKKCIKKKFHIKGGAMKNVSKELTEEEIDIIEKNYLIKNDIEIGEMLGRKSGTIKRYRYKYGFLKQRQTFINEVDSDKKWCWYCSEVHSKEMFSFNSSKPDGLQDECKIAVKKLSIIRKQKKKEKIENIEKTCVDCGETMNITHFIKNISTSDGYSNKCKTCMNKEKNKPRFILGGEKNV